MTVCPLIDLMIVGAQKAGTTSLNNYLKSHPDIAGHNMTEFSFFVNQQEYDQGFEKAFKLCFNFSGENTVIAKNVTISLREDSIRRLKRHNPEIKIIFLLREPVHRAYSAYTMAVKDGWMNRPFSEFNVILQAKDYNDIMYRHFIGHGIYANQLETIFRHFPPRNIRIYLFEDLRKDPQKICDNIFEWLNLSKVSIEKLVHNATFQPRSIWLGAMINKLRQEKNPIKKVVKTVAPYSLFRLIGDKIMSVNQTNRKFDLIDPEIENVLRHHFLPHNRKLLKLINQIDHHCLVTSESETWLT